MKSALLFTGGKDCCLALHESLKAGQDVAALVTFAPKNPDFLAHPLSVMTLQAAAIGIPHLVMEVAEPYEQGYRDAIVRLRDEHGIGVLITGDIDLVAGQPNWIRQCCEGSGVEVRMPLWHRDREGLMRELVDEGFRVVLSCVKRPWLTPDFAGRTIDDGCLEEFKLLHAANGLDLCGENGEYHSLVLDGPIFRRLIRLDASSVVRDEMAYLRIERVELA